MPLPLLPAVLIGGAIAAGVKGAVDTITGLEKIQKAEKRYKRHRERYEDAERAYRRRRAKLEVRLTELGKTRLRAMTTLRVVVEFLQRARLTSQPALEQFAVTNKELTRWRGAGVAASEVLNTIRNGVGAGVGTATLVYQAAGMLGTASTGTAIGTLSGAAAESAALAWLGGGALAAGGGGIALGTAVLGGLVAGPAFLVSGFFVAAQAERVKTEVARQIAAMEVAEAQMARQQDEFTIIKERIQELDLNICRLVVQLEDVLASADPNKSEDVYLVVRLARALADLLKVPVLNGAKASSTRRHARG